MKPGRELDRLIAERVMGWKQATTRQRYVTHGCTHVLPDGGLDVVPEFSTDLAAAWEVVEHLEKQYDTGYESFISADTDNRTYRFEVIAMNPYLALGLEFSESLPHAICLAALKAVGYQGTSTV